MWFREWSETISNFFRSRCPHSRLRLVVGAAAGFCLLITVGFTSGQEITTARAVDQAAGKIAESFPLLRGLVVEVEGDRVLIDLGARRGVFPGMVLEVYREAGEIKHPVTGEPLGRRELRLAMIRVVDVKEEFSEAAAVRHEKEVKLSWGDRVRVSGDRITVALPLIDPGDVRGANVRSITKDLAIALIKTGRFMVLEEHLIRSALASDGIPGAKPSTDPASLKALEEKLRAEALILGKLSPTESGIFLDLHVFSTLTGATIGLTSIPLPSP